jgi:acetoin utilization protein AcuB
MLVRDYMTMNPISVRPDSDPRAALGLCKSAGLRRLPVVDREGHVVGIVTRTSLEQFLVTAPPPSVQVRQHEVRQVMQTPVITVTPDEPMEEAARRMVVHKIGSLPVVADGRLIGIVTDTDIFRQFVEILGGQSDAVRVTVVVPDVPGSLARVVNAIADLQGNVRSAIIVPSDDPGCRSVTLWVEDLGSQTLAEALKALEGVSLTRVWSRAQAS